MQRTERAGIVPYAATPKQTRKDTLSDEECSEPDASPPQPESPSRLESNRWDFPQATRKQPHGCITDSGRFRKMCLDVDILQVAYLEIPDAVPQQSKRKKTGNYEKDGVHKEYRYSPYRLFTRWLWQRMGKGNRRVLPACVVEKKTATFPSARNTGFRYPPL